MRGNPEFRKNLWLELSPARLAGMPLVLCALFLLTWLADDRAFGRTTRSVSMGAFTALCFLWGTHQSSESVAREVRERTWDWTRLSAIRPWPLAWGKLFGSTAYTWLGGIFCLLVLLLASPRDPAGNARTVALLVLGALCCQALGMLAGLQALSRGWEAPRSQSSGLVVLLFFVVSPFLSFLSAKGDVAWYGLSTPVQEFVVASMAVAWGWTVAGIRGRLREEFRMPTLPAAWCAFVPFLMAYAAGFLHGHGAAAMKGAALGTAAALAYGAVFLERKDPVALKRLVAAGSAGEWRRVAEGVPSFLLALPFVFAAAAGFALDPGETLRLAAGEAGSRALVAAGTAFLVRDLSLVLFLHLGPSPKRADLFSLLCLAVLYGLAPAILQQLGSETGAALFWPVPGRWELSLGSAAAQAAAAAWAAAGRWRK